MGFIRLFLAVSVLNTHAPFTRTFLLVDGGLAVLLFYIISGFYMSLIINERYSSVDKWIRKFYLNRILRLFPTYWVIAIISILYFHFIGRATIFSSDLGLSLGKHITLLLVNIFLFGHDITRMLGSAGYEPVFVYPGYAIPFAWTLGVELTFYLIAPFVVRANLKKTLLILVIMFSIRLILIYLNWPSTTWRHLFSPSLMVFFMLGHMSYLLYFYLKSVNFPKQTGAYISLLIVIYLSQDIIGGGGLHQNDPDGFKNWLFYILVASSIPFIFRFTQSSKIDAFVGNLSYPVYLWHHTAIVYADHSLKHLGEYKNISVVVLSIICAIIINYAVERPVDKLVRRKLVPRKANGDSPIHKRPLFKLPGYSRPELAYWLIISIAFVCTVHILDAKTRGALYSRDYGMKGEKFWSKHDSVDVSKSNGKTPIQLPGPDDSWAGGVGKQFTIKPPYERDSKYVLFIWESHDISPPLIEILVGDKKVAEYQVPAGNGTHPGKWRSDGRKSEFEFYLSQSLLSSGDKVIVRTTKGSWVAFSGLAINVEPPMWEKIIATLGWLTVFLWVVYIQRKRSVNSPILT